MKIFSAIFQTLFNGIEDAHLFSVEYDFHQNIALENGVDFQHQQLWNFYNELLYVHVWFQLSVILVLLTHLLSIWKFILLLTTAIFPMY